MLTFTKTKQADGTLFKAEYHVEVQLLQPKDEIPDDSFEKFLEFRVKNQIANHMMGDLIKGIGRRGVTMSDVYRYNQLHSCKESAKT